MKNESPDPSQKPESFIRKHWVVITSIAGACFMLILNAPTLVTNLENLPTDVSRITTKFLGWYYDDEGWTGFWSEFPEGIVDMEDMKLSRTPIGIDITSTSGEIVGMIGTREICLNLPIVTFLLFEGKIQGNEAIITAYDIIGGKREEFTKLKLRRDKDTMMVQPIDGIIDLFPQEARIGHHPNYDADTSSNYFNDLCTEKLEALSGKLGKNNKKIRRPAHQLKYSFPLNQESSLK